METTCRLPESKWWPSLNRQISSEGYLGMWLMLRVRPRLAWIPQIPTAIKVWLISTKEKDPPETTNKLITVIMWLWCIRLLDSINLPCYNKDSLLSIMPTTTPLHRMPSCLPLAIGPLSPSKVWTNNSRRCASQTQIRRIFRTCPNSMSPLAQRHQKLLRRHWGAPNRTPWWSNIISPRANRWNLRLSNAHFQLYSRSSLYRCHIINSYHRATPPPLTTL